MINLRYAALVIALGQRDREFRALPEAGGGRCDLGVTPAADPVTEFAFGFGEQFVEAIEVGAPGQCQVVPVGELGARFLLVVFGRGAMPRS